MFFFLLRAYQNILFYRICEADPLTAKPDFVYPGVRGLGRGGGRRPLPPGTNLVFVVYV